MVKRRLVKMQRYLLYVLIFGGLAILHFGSCSEIKFTENPAQDLTFSVDTLQFDTVFTTVGSSTRLLKVYNQNEDAVRISNIYVDRGESSQFRLNIDGITTNMATDVEILANDSMYIFVEVTVNPDAPLTESPFVIGEDLIFEFYGKEQSVLLEAFGQNANYFPSKSAKGSINQLTCNLQEVVWDDPKPYVIYGILVIDSCDLVLPAGTQIYIHGGISNIDGTIWNEGLIAFNSNSTLISQGTAENPVIIQGDRLEPVFENVPGQWTGIWFLPGSKSNKLEYTTVKNSIFGIRVDSSSTLSLNNSQILNTSNQGLLGIHSTIFATNCLFHSNGLNSVALTYGGTYTFSYSTIANYGNQASGLRIDNFRCEPTPIPCTGQIFANKVVANFTNCIITGSGDDELELEDIFNGDDPSQFSYSFKNCIIKADELLDENGYPTLIEDSEGSFLTTNQDTLFVDIDDDIYRLDTMSIGEGRAIPLPSVAIDILGNDRDAMTPDIGCYEFIFE